MEDSSGGRAPLPPSWPPRAAPQGSTKRGVRERKEKEKEKKPQEKKKTGEVVITSTEKIQESEDRKRASERPKRASRRPPCVGGFGRFRWVFLLCCACETKAAFATGPLGPPVALCYASPPWLVVDHCSSQALEGEGDVCVATSGTGPEVQGDLRSLGEKVLRGGFPGLLALVSCAGALQRVAESDSAHLASSCCLHEDVGQVV